MKVYLREALPGVDKFVLEDEFWNHYLTTVRRLDPGAAVEVVGETEVAPAKITAVDPLEFEITSRRPANRPTYNFWLLQALTRKKKVEDSIKRGAELGVTHFLPLYTQRTVRRPNKPEKQKRRWRKIALDSTRITDRDWAPQIFTPVELTDFTDQLPELDELFWATPDGDPPAASFSGEQSDVGIVVGPEGGFTETEAEFLRDLQAGAVSLGDQNFRAETAAQTLTTLWLYHQGHLPVSGS